jgi:UDP-N-acetylglucosamine 2-epimerase (non-hydrolysing)
MSTNKYDVLTVLGTRPEIIKLAPVIRSIEDSNKLSGYIVHTGQHYDDELSGTFFRSLQLPDPDEQLHVGSGTQGEQTAGALKKIEKVVAERSPDVVIALGDTNAVLSAALATSKMEPQFGHIEAGIRSFDRSMPEEVNRVLADQVSDFAFAPTETAADNLDNERVVGETCVVGNTVVDACFEHTPIAEKKSSILNELELTKGEYTTATIHRPRNTDNTDRLTRIIEALDAQDFLVVFPIHPRTRNKVKTADITYNGSLSLIDSLDYLDFLKLLNNSRVVVTDSGGVQEEASILEVPCLTVRPNTERPETIEAGVNELIEPSAVHGRLKTVYQEPDIRESMTGHPNLYGDGNSAENIVSILENEL